MASASGSKRAWALRCTSHVYCVRLRAVGPYGFLQKALRVDHPAELSDLFYFLFFILFFYAFSFYSSFSGERVYHNDDIKAPSSDIRLRKLAGRIEPYNLSHH
ncbi:hypothetical protein RJT34_19297 [Clitoria ternatea]|uniref:Uncharacterized protein n=1 Tax=Clitoria ternatea TaxID=43366 RepID=A0AAN9IQT0_CLITE